MDKVLLDFTTDKMKIAKIKEAIAKGLLENKFIGETVPITAKNPFEQLQQYAKLVPPPIDVTKALAWYKQAITKISGTITQSDILSSKNLFSSAPPMTTMLMFRYNPSTAEKLPYYDTFPLVIPLKRLENGNLLGLNLHYLDREDRAALFKKIKKDFQNKTEIQMTYDAMLGRTRYKDARPCIRSYALSNIGSKILNVPSDDWVSVLFLPVESFKKAAKTKVWSDSKVKGQKRLAYGSHPKSQKRTNPDRDRSRGMYKPREKK
jgi:hypothetical protein